ncbi:Chorismate mutase [Methylocella silvestris BL2]|uniref:chorismate mutase n=1 Tax=Methylocella silvestris (strain DSM 15510 / CIP 108128 / LMG 27833 / NCIMB 13906 / BL2) TaxID=395965 RepID=B8EPH1_METSB|nr:chorismate mutase [Methylocella silvestris]ACK50176.1 Chorismate mutase [Methylocella silvestris BL2]
MTHPARLETLADLRVEIDCIDSELHQLLIKRGEIIHRLIEAKARQGGGLEGRSAFRPGREADMMRALVSRHSGLLPLDTVESIWRIIISTFTYVQSAYAVHADVSGGDARMRDCCRFHFGFTVPYQPHADADAVTEAVLRSSGDLGLVPVAAGPASSGWWRRLKDSRAPKIIARLPFVERPDHPAGTPLFVVAHPLAEAAVRDVIIYDVSLGGAAIPPQVRLEQIEADIIAAAEGPQASLLVSAPGAVSRAELADAFAVSEAAVVEIGGHAARCKAAEARRDPAPFAVAQ